MSHSFVYQKECPIISIDGYFPKLRFSKNAQVCKKIYATMMKFTNFCHVKLDNPDNSALEERLF